MTAENDLSFHRRVLAEFIKLYRSYPCLWMVKCPEYRDRCCKDLAYERLVLKLREIDPTADREKVVKKVNSLRTNWRKEKRKVDKASAIRPYKPRLWYFRLFEFLADDPNNFSMKYDDNDPIEEQEEPDHYDNMEYEELPIDEQSEEGYYEEYKYKTTQMSSKAVEGTPTSSGGAKTKSAKPTHSIAMKSQKRTHSSNDEEQILSYESVALQQKRKPPTPDERHDIFGRNVAMKLRDIRDKTQRLLAEKLINDALFMAELGELSMEHGVTSFNTRSHTPLDETEYLTGTIEQYEELSQHSIDEMEPSISNDTSANPRMQDMQRIPHSMLRRI